MRAAITAIIVLLAAQGAQAETLTVTAQPITEWKSVYGEVETRDRVPARARIGGTIVTLEVTEGDRVAAGARIAVVEDDKLAFQLDSIDARLEALKAQLETAQADLARGQQLIERGFVTGQRLEQLQTQVDVVEGNIRSLESERLIVEQQVAEGEVLAPEAGVVLSVPISRGSVVAPGEAMAVIGGGGVFLRLAVPERHAGDLAEGDTIQIAAFADSAAPRTGRLVKLYPQIEGGRVQADVEVEGLDGRFVGRRLPVRLPVGERHAILVPEAALSRAGGLDIVEVETDTGEALGRAVVPGGTVMVEGAPWREILTGLAVGDRVVLGHE
ncbi:efflux RND transporter periplasmic adaptor subunit [Actibacterium sp. MT2.3-13A]|uniref:efflux RND transporter periplasmic adaptor subunit n=1 Tax=Actibacterium sp. MT2.3-13A TaxID=2828332 RepID=UPI001BAE2F35|nr:efflux RND transporter periplasmic adaptor subunit [Actibacterium sp. MT2.3-13A]